MAKASETTAKSSKLPLKPRQAAFIREYVAARCKNAKQAAIRAGYAGDASAEVTASRLLRNPTVAAEIERAQGRLLRRDETSRDRWLRELETLAFFDPIECFDAKGRLLSLHRMPERARHTVASLVRKGAEFKLVFHDRDKALTPRKVSRPLRQAARRRP